MLLVFPSSSLEQSLVGFFLTQLLITRLPYFFCSGNFPDVLMTDSLSDLRDDKQFFAEHPGAVPISTAQVPFLILLSCGSN